MQSVIDDKVRCPATYSSTCGYYGWGSNFQWVGCRNALNQTMNAQLVADIMAYSMEKARKDAGFFHSVCGAEGELQLANYAKCVHAIESHLDLYSRSLIHTTNVMGVVYVEPSVFWHTVPLRLSFFTIWVRAAMLAAHKMKEVDEAVPSVEAILAYDPYFKATTNATGLFCQGRTYIDNFEPVGWLDYFQGALGNSLAAAEGVLSHPRQFNHEIWLKKVKAKADALAKTEKKGTLDDHWKKAEYLCSLAACIG